MPYGSVLNVNINDNNTCTIGILALFHYKQTQKVPLLIKSVHIYTCGMRVIREYGSTLYIGIAMVFCGTFGHM